MITGEDFHKEVIEEMKLRCKEVGNTTFKNLDPFKKESNLGVMMYSFSMVLARELEKNNGSFFGRN